MASSVRSMGKNGIFNPHPFPNVMNENFTKIMDYSNIILKSNYEAWNS